MYIDIGYICIYIYLLINFDQHIVYMIFKHTHIYIYIYTQQVVPGPRRAEGSKIGKDYKISMAYTKAFAMQKQ